jgi:hypothetical protein
VYPVLCGVRFVGQKNFDIIEMHGATTKKKSKYTLLSIHFFFVYEVMCKNIVQPDRPQTTK